MGGVVKTFCLALAVALTAPMAAMADSPKGQSADNNAVVPQSLIDAANANPKQVFSVIVQGTGGESSRGMASDVQNGNGKVKKQFLSIVGTSADITGKDLLKLARNPHVSAITLDVPVASAGYVNAEMWRATVHADLLQHLLDPVTSLILGPAPQAPAIAIVDSGIDASKVADFGGRVVGSVNLSSLSPGATGDQEGHGTMVAGVAAGASAAYGGVAENAPLVDVRTADASGQSLTSDVIAAADWIVAHAQQYNIKVANFSMAGTADTSFRFDPLDRAVEKLWFHGIVVVTAAGNHGTGTGPVSMSKAPGNDPFVITVGAADQMGTADPLDDTIAPWSAYGYTMDGFSKPDMVAPGRYMIMPVPTGGSTIQSMVPDRVVAPGYMWMSGTSFAAPVVAGAAAQILARHPDWGPNEVKGALMLTANYLPNVTWQQAGVGEIDANAAATLGFTPPNPNEQLYAYTNPTTGGAYNFIATDPVTGERSFNQASWASAVQASASWASASWASASWASASWASASWASASWSSASWASGVTSMMQPLATLSASTNSAATLVQ